MSRNIRLLLLLTSSMLIVVSPEAQSNGGDRRREPSLFYHDYEDTGFHNAKPPSDAVLNALLKTPEAKLNSDRLSVLDRTQLSGLFRVVRVHLTTSDEVDWVVGGKFPMTSADGDWFWLVREAKGQPEVVLFASGLSLELLTKRTMAFKDVRTVWSSAAGYTLTDIYHFDGTRYRRVHAFTKTDRLP